MNQMVSFFTSPTKEGLDNLINEPFIIAKITSECLVKAGVQYVPGLEFIPGFGYTIEEQKLFLNLQMDMYMFEVESETDRICELECFLKLYQPECEGSGVLIDLVWEDAPFGNQNCESPPDLSPYDQEELDVIEEPSISPSQNVGEANSSPVLVKEV